MTEGRREVWLEIASLVLALVGLVSLTIAAYLMTMLVAHWMLTGHVRMDVGPGIVASWKEQALGIVALGLPGAALLAGAWVLRTFLGQADRIASMQTDPGRSQPFMEK